MVRKKINEYHSRVLKLWADVLIHEGKITSIAITEMQTAATGTDGYERKMRQLFEECGGYSTKPNLDDSMLFKWLTLFHVAPIEQMTKTYVNLGSLDIIIFRIISQFVQLHIVHESKLNVLHLTCNVVKKNAGQQPPVMAYLSSDILDQFVESMGRFPSTDQFIHFLQSKNDAEMTSTFQPLSPTFWNQTSETSAFNGGKKTRRKKNKKLKNVKKSKKSRRRFIKIHHRR